MTLYHANITVPAGTPKENPVTKTLIIEDYMTVGQEW